MQTDTEMGALAAGLELMLAGMGTVLVFLSLLIVVTHVMSTLVQRLQPDLPVAIPQDGVSDEELAAISAAVHRYRRERN